MTDPIDLDCKLFEAAPAQMKAAHPKVSHTALVRAGSLKFPPVELGGVVVRVDGNTYQVLGVREVGDDVQFALRRVLKIGKG